MKTPTVYVGAYGFADNDALGHIWADSPETFASAMEEALRDTAETYGDDEWCEEHESRECDCDTTDQAMDSLWYVGPFAESVHALAHGMEDRSRRAELFNDLRASTSGYVY